MLMSEFKAYVRYNGSSWEYRIEDGYTEILTIMNFDTKSDAEAEARVAVQKMVTKANSIQDATDWERIEL